MIHGHDSLSVRHLFLIDLERELRRGPGKAHQFLQRHSQGVPCLAWTIAGEFAGGFGSIHDPVCAALLDRFEILPMDEATAHHYARRTGQLRKQNQLIGAHDLWIAAAALAHDQPLVTNNTGHFSRIPGLSIISY